MQHRKWAEQQIAGLVEIGIDLADAQRSIRWVLATMPVDADPATWIPSQNDLDDGVTDGDVQDARAWWYASDSVPPRWKSVLDAVQEEG